MSIVKLLAAGAEFNELVSKIGKSSSAVQADIHQAACSAFNHAFTHGDNTGVRQLMDAVEPSKGIRRLAIAHWFNHFSDGKIVLSQEKEVNADTGFKDWKINHDRFQGWDKCDVHTNLTEVIEEAMETSFADLVPEKAHTTLILKKFLKSLSRSATNRKMFDGTRIPQVSGEVNEVASMLVGIVEKYMAERDAAKPSIDVVNAIKDAQVGIDIPALLKAA
jgi:hypothetical protein